MFQVLRSRSTSPLPLNTKPSPRAAVGRRGFLSFFTTAAISGILFHLLFVGFGGTEYVREVPVLGEWMPAKTVYEPCVVPAAPPAAAIEETLPTPAPEPPKRDDQQLLSVPEIQEIVSRTKGYLTRDYSLGLGWNNMRYIIESALMQATLLNRTLVLPSFVYARSCEWEIQACAAFATMVNRGDAIGWGEWRTLPIEKQMGWRIPMSMMLDLPHLRETYNVILIEEYLRLHGMDPGKEWSNGAWHRTEYLAPGKNMTLFQVKNNEYDPEGVVRVDSRFTLMKKVYGEGHHHEHEERDMPSVEGEGQVHEKLKAALGNDLAMDWSRVQMALSDMLVDTRDAESMEKLLAENGWATIHTFAGALGMDYLKSVVQPVRQATPLSRIRGWADDYDHITADILVIEGEIHLGRKPGGMRFTSIKARDNFSRMVLYGLRPTERVRDLAAEVHDRMLQKVGGRMWMAGHMRRGDFVTTGWAMEGTIEAHFERIKGRLALGRQILESIHNDNGIRTYDIPDVMADDKQLLYAPPLEDDPFFLATDERSPEGIAHMKANGALLIGDLITMDDRRKFGWAIMLTDVLALVEQSVLGRSYYFYAHAMSSVAGGAVNMRAARGVDPRTTLID